MIVVVNKTFSTFFFSFVSLDCLQCFVRILGWSMCRVGFVASKLLKSSSQLERKFSYELSNSALCCCYSIHTRNTRKHKICPFSAVSEAEKCFSLCAKLRSDIYLEFCYRLFSTVIRYFVKIKKFFKCQPQIL